jgi:hypothetical protein
VPGRASAAGAVQRAPLPLTLCLSSELSHLQGFTTDPTRPVHVWALDFSYRDGTFVKRDLGQVRRCCSVRLHFAL